MLAVMRFAALLVLASAAVAGDPVPEHAHLFLARDIVASPVSVLHGNETEAGPLRIAWERNHVRAFARTTDEPAWDARAPAGQRPVWLASDADTAYFVLRDPGHVWPAGTILRLNLANGTWRVPWQAPGGDVVDAEADADGLLVLTTTALTSLRAGLTWTQPLPDGDQLGSGPAWLAPAGDDVVLCTSRQADLVAYRRATGEESWRVRRLWEYRRDIYGFRRLRTPDERKEARRTCEIVAGPCAVPSADGYRLFVGVRSLEAGYVYEITAQGQVLAVVQLPRLPRPGGARAATGGVLFVCEGDAIARVEPSGGVRHGVGRLAWYREPPPGTQRPVLAVGDRYAYACDGGEIVATDTGPLFRCPIVRTELATGVERELTLEVPCLPGIEAPEPLRVHWLAAEPHALRVGLGRALPECLITFELR